MRRTVPRRAKEATCRVKDSENRVLPRLRRRPLWGVAGRTNEVFGKKQDRQEIAVDDGHRREPQGVNATARRAKHQATDAEEAKEGSMLENFLTYWELVMAQKEVGDFRTFLQLCSTTSSSDDQRMDRQTETRSSIYTGRYGGRRGATFCRRVRRARRGYTGGGFESVAYPHGICVVKPLFCHTQMKIYQWARALLPFFYQRKACFK